MSFEVGVAIYCPLPPTSNNLDPHQRSRLIRSTRKLGAVLGTTPQLLEPLPPASTRPRRAASIASTKRPSIFPGTSKVSARPLPIDSSLDHRRDARVFEYSPSPSVTSFETADQKGWVKLPRHSSDAALPSPSSYCLEHDTSRPRSPATVEFEDPSPPAKKPKSKQNHVQPLFLRLQPVAVSSSDTRVNPSSPTAHSLASSKASKPAYPPSPLTPTFSAHINATPCPDLRRKKMAKLARTLGESVPPELVFGYPRSSSPSPMPSPTKHKYSKSQATPTMKPTSVAPTGSPTISLRRGRSMSVSTSHETLPPSIDVTLPPFSNTHPRAVVAVQVTTNSDSNASAEKPSGSQGRAPPSSGAHRRGLEVPEWGRRKEREWSGEWNVRDMDAVVSRLRDLKAR